MTTKTTTIIALILIGLALLAGAVLWNQLPDQMASHWNANDRGGWIHVQILGRIPDAAHHTGNVGSVPCCFQTLIRSRRTSRNSARVSTSSSC